MNRNLKKIVIKYLNSEFSNLEQYETKKYPDYIFFKKDNKVIFDYNKENGYVYISYDEIWSFLESFFGLEYKEIQDLTKEWVEEHFKLRVTTTAKSWMEHPFVWRKTLQIKGNNNYE